MIGCRAQVTLRHRTLDVAGCPVDVALGGADEAGSTSAAAARLAEELVALRCGCDTASVRVATLLPSGRPVATVRGRPDAVRVSVSHADAIVGAAACVTASVGIDIVAPAEAGRSLDAWFTPDELALHPDDGLLRARLWGAKEAAFKAAGLDDGFRPCAVSIDDLGRRHFRWSLRGDHRTVRGAGVFVMAGMHLVAVAAATLHEDATSRRRPHDQPLHVKECVT